MNLFQLYRLILPLLTDYEGSKVIELTKNSIRNSKIIKNEGFTGIENIEMHFDLIITY